MLSDLIDQISFQKFDMNMSAHDYFMVLVYFGTIVAIYIVKKNLGQ